MAPTVSKKGGGGLSRGPQRDRRSTSRHSTPVSASDAPTTHVVPTGNELTDYLKTPTIALINPGPGIRALVTVTGTRNHEPPPAKDLHAIHSKLEASISRFVDKRAEEYDRCVRHLTKQKKERERLSQQHSDEPPTKKIKHEESMPRVGAHGLARQDGVNVHQGPPAPPSPPVPPGTAAIDPMDVAETPDEDHGVSTPLYERAFGLDPSTFNDPTVYRLKCVDNGMDDGEKRDALQVAYWPTTDLRDQITGDPPDADFRHAKPTTQITFQSFQSYVEPYLRHYTEEDITFLKERGDRVTPFIIPPREKKTYKEVWASEDGVAGNDLLLKTAKNHYNARGSVDDLDDGTIGTDNVSMGPAMNRFMSVFQPMPRVTEDGDTVIGESEEQKPLTCILSDAYRPANLRHVDFEMLEKRVLQELRYVGLLSTGEVPHYELHEDDELSARLRTLQHELRNVSRINHVRKARVRELVEERMAMQEYNQVADDLDNQVIEAYVKRNRSQGKPAKKTTSLASRGVVQKGVATSSAVKEGMESIRTVVAKRKNWHEMLGPAVNYGRPDLPDEFTNIFDDESMKRLERAEAEAVAAETED